MSDSPTTPMSNVENYLSVMAGLGGELPNQPSSNVERLLLYMIENGTGMSGGGSGEGGTTNYNALMNKPQIGGVELQGNKTAAELGLAGSADIPTDFYSKTEVDAKLSGKADSADIPTDFYSKSEVDTKLSGKANTADIPTDFYSKSEMDAKLSGKANTADIPTDFYSKSEMDAKLVEKVNAETGKGLSANDYTDAEKTKLAGIPADAEANPGVATEETDGLMAASDKRRIAVLEQQNALLQELIAGVDAPIYRTSSGNPAAFADGYADAAVRALSVDIQAVQSGSGAASPSNVRPISGWDAVTVTRSGADGADAQAVTVSTGDAGTVYGGTLDVATGKLSVTHGFKDAGTRIPESWLSPPAGANENLLENWYFASPHNANGKTVYSGMDTIINTINRWVIAPSGGTTENNITLADDGLVFTCGAPGTAYPTFRQDLTETVRNAIKGRTVTLSAIVNGQLYRETTNVPASGTYSSSGAVIPGAGFFIGLTSYANTVDSQIVVRITSNNVVGSIKIQAVKLELGSTQTLASQNADGSWAASLSVPDGWISSNGVLSTSGQAAYALAEPVSYNLTARELTTLGGENIVSSNAGPVDVTYRADAARSVGI